MDYRKKVVVGEKRNWDLMLPYVVFCPPSNTRVQFIRTAGHAKEIMDSKP